MYFKSITTSSLFSFVQQKQLQDKHHDIAVLSSTITKSFKSCRDPISIARIRLYLDDLEISNKVFCAAFIVFVSGMPVCIMLTLSQMYLQFYTGSFRICLCIFWFSETQQMMSHAKDPLSKCHFYVYNFDIELDPKYGPLDLTMRRSKTSLLLTPCHSARIASLCWETSQPEIRAAAIREAGKRANRQT